jgi:hypothetical protein
MRKLIVLAILLLVSASSYATILHVYSIDAATMDPVPFATTAITIDGSTWTTRTDVNGEYSFAYTGANVIPWTSYVKKDGWDWYSPNNGYITTMVTVPNHKHYLIQ